MIHPPERSQPSALAGRGRVSGILLYPYRGVEAALVRIKLYFREPSTIEVWFWAFCLFLITAPFTFVLMGEDPTAQVRRDLGTMRREDNSQLAIYAIRLFVFGAAVLFSLLHWKRTARELPRILPAMGFLGWATASLLWSDSFATSVNAALVMTLVVFTGFLIGIRLPTYHAARAIVHSATIMAVVSILFSLAVPGYGVHQVTDSAQSVHAGAWRGVYLHKNHFGQLSAIYLTAVLFAGRHVVRFQPYKWLVCALLLFLIVRSTSASALALVPLALFVAWYVVALNPMGKVLAGAGALAGGLVAILSLNLLLEMLGRDATLSGRTNIWAAAIDYISRRPLEGYGFLSSTYGGFTIELNRMMGVADPHNGYLDLMLGIGVIGLVLFFVAVVSAWTVARGVYRFGGSHGHGIMVLAGVNVAFLMATITEANVRPLGAVGGTGLCVLGMLLAAPRMRTLQGGLRISPRTFDDRPILPRDGAAAKMGDADG